MRSLLFFCLIFLVNAETQSDAASYARFFVQNGLHGVFSTRMLDVRFSFASVEDFAELPETNGDIVFLLADISETAKNLMKYPFGSFTIYEGNCTVNDFNHMPYDPLACARFTVVGKFLMNPYPVNVTDPDFLAFASKHPAAIDWINHSGHEFRMWNVKFYSIHYVGGYGDLHYIGPIGLDVYSDAKPVHPK